jgi:hypothetical protein
MSKNNLAIMKLNLTAVIFPSGVYLYRLQAGDFTMVKKKLMIK